MELGGELCLPDDPLGVIVFIGGCSGPDRPHTRPLADALVHEGFATIIVDLLTTDEDLAERTTKHLRFDVGMLAARLVEVLGWIQRQPHLQGIPVGIVGTGTCAAAALIAGSRVHTVAAIAIRGGRPDLAADALPAVVAPVLMIVGSAEDQLREQAQRAMVRMTTRAKLHVLESPHHLAQEPSVVEELTLVISMWFRKHLAPPALHEEIDPIWPG
jgi:dienelactone hydrolase